MSLRLATATVLGFLLGSVSVPAAVALAVDGSGDEPAPRAVLAETQAPTLAQVGPYSDVDPDSYAAQPIASLVARSVFDGTECAPDTFCPSQSLPRWVMAVWVVRIVDGQDPPEQRSRFVDIAGDPWWEGHVERFAELGITSGCTANPARFCPDGRVSREQMAVFLTAAFDLPDGPEAGFVDVARHSFFSRAIDSLAHSGITAGCATDPPKYCPTQDVSREQLATLLYRAIGLGSQPATGPPSVFVESSAPLVVDGRFEVAIRFSAPVTGFEATDITVVNGRATSVTGSRARYTASIEPAAAGTVMVRLPAEAARGDDGSPSGASAPFIRVSAPRASIAPTGIDTWIRPLVLQSADLELSRVEPHWEYTGNVDGCVASSTSREFRESVIQRVSWYRQMAGLGAVEENPALSADAQQAALIMAAQNALSHTPGTGAKCYSPAGAASAGRSNLGLGNAGVGGVDAYMRDSGNNNLRVGHRRWILYPQTLEMGTGNARKPGQHFDRKANALDVIGGEQLANRPSVREERGFVAWPPSGYVPASVVWGRWSFSLPEADFSNASVAVADDSGSVTVETLDRDSVVGEPAIVWAVAGDTNSRLLPAPANGDHCYTVTVSGVRVGGEIPTPFEYPVCVIDPDAPTGPSVTLSSGAPDTVGGSFDVTVTFSEPVNGFTREDIFVVNGAVTALSGRGQRYDATIRLDDNGAVTVAVGAGAIHDSASLPNTAAVPLRRTASVGRPTASVTSSAGATVRGAFEVSITFSEPVTGFSTSGVRVVNGTVSNLTGDGASYRAMVTPSNDGTVMVRILQDAAVAGSGRANHASAPLTRTQRAVSSGNTPGIDTWDRASVQASYAAEFERVEPDWGYTGDVDGCVAGTTSQEFRDSVLGRLNWYRTMAGLARVAERLAYTSAAQQSALMSLANGTFSIGPAARCYTPEGARTAGQGPGGLGLAGPSAIDTYMGRGDQPGLQRTAMLSPYQAEVGIGHARDPDSIYRVGHKLYLGNDDPTRAQRPAVREARGFVAWPPPGYVPPEMLPQLWSFMLAKADFSRASVSVADHSGSVPVTIAGSDAWYQERVIWWSVADVDALARRVGPTDADHCYTVTVSGARINSKIQSPYEYAVCILDRDP